MTRAEHLAWCKRRALEYLDRGDIQNAVTSMLSDLNKHDETRLSDASPLVTLGIMTIMQRDMHGARRFIEGFKDADFIAHARTDIPYLLSRLREAEAVRLVFESVTDSDWDRLEGLINDSAHGRFWKGVFRRARAALDEKEV